MAAASVERGDGGSAGDKTAAVPTEKRSALETASKVLPLLILIAAIIYISGNNPYFLRQRNIISVLLQTSSLAFMALGMTFVLIVAGIDLSIPPVMALSAIVGVMHMKAGGHPLLSVAIMMGVGVLCGMVNGASVAFLRMIPFVVTLSMQMITYGLCLWLTDATGVSGIAPAFQSTVLYRLYGIPLPVVAMFAVMIVAELFMRKSYLGRWLYLTGNNEKMAMVSGIPSKMVIFSAYVLSGLLASFAGMILCSRMGAASPTVGKEVVVMDIVGAAVVGGASTNGGVGRAVGAVFGAIFITIISNAANMLHISYNMLLFVKGALILLFVALDMLKHKRAE